VEASDFVYWLALSPRRWLVPISKIEQIYNQSHSLAVFWKAERNYLYNLGISDKTVSKFFAYRDSVRLEDFQRLLETLERDGVKVLRYVDKNYPRFLRDFGNYREEPPLVLFYKGSPPNDTEGVAIVGTRECSHYGHMMARRFGRVIASHGYTIVSGLARGVDIEAHCGALENPHGRTMAVLAWMNPIYPPENVELAKDMLARGTLLSEMYFKPDSKFGNLTPGKFVERNRITSGISRCVIAIESGTEGGTVHQVRIALAQGRRVFALKPKSENKRAKDGFKLFLDMGATPINSAKPVLEFMRKLRSQDKSKDRRIDSFYQHPISSSEKG
jgi:DNA processing protein